MKDRPANEVLAQTKMLGCSAVHIKSIVHNPANRKPTTAPFSIFSKTSTPSSKSEVNKDKLPQNGFKTQLNVAVAPKI